jgi:AsmA protein
MRWLLRGAAIIALIAAIFASALPFLADDQTVREALVGSLSEWSGGPVAIRGTLRIKSFTPPSIEAERVSFASTPRLSPVDRIEAKSVTAVLKVRSLLLGRIEFKKVAVSAPRIVLSRRTGSSKLDFLGLEAAGAAVAFADLSRFDRLELQNCAFFAATGERRAYSRLTAETIGVTHNPGDSNFTLYLRDQGLDASFRGTLSRAGSAALGSIRLNVPAEHPAAEKIVAAIAPWEKGHGVSIAGDLTWAGERMSLDGATIGFGSNSAKGSLTFAAQRGRALTEGTLAYDGLEWMSAGPEAAGSGGAIEPLRALIAASGRGNGHADFDMRISAEHFRAGAYEAGPLALALTSRSGLLSIDVAELAIFGGRIAGRLDYDSRHPTMLTVNANGTRLEPEALAGATAWPVAVSGPVTFRLALEIPFRDRPFAQEIEASTGSFGLVFPSGGTLDGDLSKRLSEAFAQGQAPWSLTSGSFPFAAAAIDGSIKPGAVALKLDGEAEASRVTGSLRIAIPSGQVSGTLVMKPDEEGTGETPPAPSGSPNSASIGLSGTVAALNFSAIGKHNLSN